MTQKEATNIIVKLTQEGWKPEKINAFMVYVETHNPSEKEAMDIIRKAEESE